MGHTETKNYTATQGEIMDWVSVNSLLNITNWNFWTVGTCKDAAEAESWSNENSEATVRYFKAFEAASFDEAAETVELYVSQGSETTADGDGPAPGPIVYIYKTFF